nr:hypothetical protein [Campylobacter jejuni]
MYNPNSAIERVKNHLAYKLGQAMIDFTNNGGGYIALFKKLYKIKKQHKKEQKIYQQTIQVFPQLKYPSLEACSDYEQALRYKFHLSYMLGEVLIKADVNKFKDGYFFLFKNIEQTKKDYKIIKEILDLSKKFEENIYTILAENKNLFMCNLDNLKIILDLHKNYIPVLKVIFQNFNYTLNHLEMIQEWLLSSDFKQRFQDVNHPYPSLLDPKKLNDQAEKINYHNISGELAWKMNLPLPENYKLIWLWAACSGTMAIYTFFNYSDISTINANGWEDEKKVYIDNYTYILSKKTHVAIAPRVFENNDKIYYLFTRYDYKAPYISSDDAFLAMFYNSDVMSKEFKKIKNELYKSFEEIKMKLKDFINILEREILLFKAEFSNIQKDHIFQSDKNFSELRAFCNASDEYFLKDFKELLFKSILELDLFFEKLNLKAFTNYENATKLSLAFFSRKINESRVLYELDSSEFVLFYPKKSEIYERVLNELNVYEFEALLINKPILTKIAKNFLEQSQNLIQEKNKFLDLKKAELQKRRAQILNVRESIKED